jgi:hypothetical protein
MEFGLLLQSYGFGLLYFLATLTGAAGMYIFSSARGFDNSRGFLQKMKPGKSDIFYYRCDFVLVSVLEGLFDYIWFAPQDAHKALAAGISWPAIFTVATTSQQNTRPARQPPKTSGKR